MKNSYKVRYWMICLIMLFLFAEVTYGQSGHDGMHIGHQSERHIYLRMMDTMMVSMDTVKSQKGPDVIFLSLMRLHHSGAISMAQYEISHGKNFEMIQLAKSILAEQQSEYLQMGMWLQNIKVNFDGVTPGFTSAMVKSMNDMMNVMPPASALNDIDRAFALVMIPHHQAAIDMAKAGITEIKGEQILNYARLLISNEKIEIDQMSNYLTKNK